MIQRRLTSLRIWDFPYQHWKLSSYTVLNGTGRKVTLDEELGNLNFQVDSVVFKFQNSSVNNFFKMRGMLKAAMYIILILIV